jgi:hypothetical protein
MFLVVFSVFGIYAQNVFLFGKETAFSLVKQAAPLNPSAEVGTAAIKVRDYPLLTIRTKEKLLLNSPPRGNGLSYEYESTGSDFLRLILQDEANYYVVESSGGQVTTHAIRKDLVQEMLFFRDASFSDGAPHDRALKPLERQGLLVGSGCFLSAGSVAPPSRFTRRRSAALSPWRWRWWSYSKSGARSRATSKARDRSVRPTRAVAEIPVRFCDPPAGMGSFDCA